MTTTEKSKNAVSVDSFLKRPEWGGDGEVYVDVQIGTDNLRVEAFLAGVILEDKGFGEPTVGFEFHNMDVWLNDTELSEPYTDVTATVDYIKNFIDGTREYNDLYDDLKEHQYLLHNLEAKLQDVTSLSELEETLKPAQNRDERMFTEDELQMVGIETASLWGAEYISHEINRNEKAVTYLCVEHGEMFHASVSFDEIQEQLRLHQERNQKQNEKERENMSKYDISARVNPLKDQSKPTKAMASITIDNAIAINNLTVVEGKSGGLFVGYPQSKGNDGSFRDIVEFLKDEQGKTTKESLNLKTEINKLLTGMYKEGITATPEKAEHEKVPVMHEIKAFVTPLRESENATKGLASVQVGDMFKINSVRINENTKEGSENFGKNFVAMPSRPDQSSESGYRDIVHPVNKEYGEHLKGTVLKQYDNQVAWKNHMTNKEQTAQRQPPATTKNSHDIG